MTTWTATVATVTWTSVDDPSVTWVVNTGPVTITGGGGGAPSGGAGGFLSGTYPNPGVNTEALQDAVGSMAGTGLTYDDAAGVINAAGGGGDVVGPASATGDAVALFNGATGKLLKNGVVLGTAAQSASGDFATAAQGVDARTPTAHNQAASTITTGTVAQARLGTGSDAAGLKFLADDQTYKTPPGSAPALLTFSNANYTIVTTSALTVVSQTGTLSAARTVTLPAASTVPAGGEVAVQAGLGCSLTNTLSVARAGADTLNGATASVVIAAAYAWRRFVSDGVSAWTLDVGIVRASNNLSDLQSAATARTNLGVTVNPWTTIAEATLGSPSAALSFTSLTATEYRLVIEGRSTTTGAGFAQALLQLNSDTAANYRWSRVLIFSGTALDGSNAVTSTSALIAFVPGSLTNTNRRSVLEARILGRSGGQRAIDTRWTHVNSNNDTAGPGMAAGWWSSTAAITSINVFLSAGDFATDTYYRLEARS